MFCRPLEHILQMHPTHIENISKNLYPHVAAAIARTKQRSKKRIQALKKFFPKSTEHKNPNDSENEALNVTKPTNKTKKPKTTNTRIPHDQQNPVPDQSPNQKQQKQNWRIQQITQFFRKSAPKNDLQPP